MSAGGHARSPWRKWVPAGAGVVVAAVVVLVIVLSGGSSTTNATGSNASSAATSSGTIKLGIPIANAATLAALGQSTRGALSVAQTELMFSSQIDALNRSGGFGAVKVKPVFEVFSLADPASIQRSCVALTQTQHVFAALAVQYVLGGDACIAQHGTPMLESVAAPQAVYDHFPGRIFTTQMAPNVNARSFAHELVSSGSLRGQKVGVLADSLGGDFAPVSQTLVPALRAGGIDVAHVTDLSANFSVAPQQIPVEISDMRSAGVTTIVDATPGPNLVLWLGGLQKAGWMPKIVMSDLNDADFAVYTGMYPPSMAGTTAYTTQRYGEHAAGLSAPASDQTCLSRYESAGGVTLAPDSANYVELEQTCQVLALFADGLKAVSGSPSQTSFAKAMSGLGSVSLPFQGPSSLGAGKPYAADAVRVTRFSATAHAFVPSATSQWLPINR